MAADPQKAPPQSAELFSSRAPERSRPFLLPWVLAGVGVVLVVLVLLVSGRHKKTAPVSGLAADDAYAASLPISDIVMSESPFFSGGKVTYIDGHIRNTGSKTITGATVQTTFGNDDAMPPQVETSPLTLIRTHEPYVDTQPVSAAPLAPGDSREFRLIFEDIGANWNQQLPAIHVVHVTSR